jgi:hypothetical protein
LDELGSNLRKYLSNPASHRRAERGGERKRNLKHVKQNGFSQTFVFEHLNPKMALKNRSRNGVAVSADFEKPQQSTTAQSRASAQIEILNVL